MAISKQNRLLGVDLMRGIATLAVVFLHSPFTNVPYAPESAAFKSIFLFAVPFFLATSFYFYALKLSSVMDWEFWRLRFQRIMIPYLLWSLIYFCLQFIVFWRSHNIKKLTELLSDPVGIIFCGGGAGQLYFLPILFSGTALMIFGFYLQKRKINIKVLASLTVLSLIFYTVLLDLDLLFKWDQPFAFRMLLESWKLLEPWYTFFRLILVLLSWWIMCLPYLLGSMILVQVVRKFDEEKKIQILKIRWWAAFGSIFYLFMYVVFCRASHLDLWVIFAAYSLLILGFLISPYIKFSKMINSISLCSFGIYLVHQPIIFYVVRQLIVVKLMPELSVQVTILSMLISSLLCFLISWLLMTVLIRNKSMARYLFGLF
jgi:peptidoglycan/LPS O-acetylase OafA/YrhL